MSEREAYLDSATSHIRDKKKRREVKEELGAHLDDMMEYYISRGVPEPEALEMAVNGMGDADELSYKLGELHSFFPAKDLRNSLTLFITGFVLVSFYIDIWYLKPITTGIGSVLLFLALYKLRTCGKLFKLSFVIYTAVMIIGAIIEAITALPLNLLLGTWPDVATHILALVSSAAYILTVSAVARLLPEERRTGLCAAEWAYGIASLIVILANAGGIIFLIAMIFFAVRLSEAKNYLWASEWDDGVRKLPKKKSAVLLSAAVLVCAAPYLTAIGVTLCPQSGGLYLQGEETEKVKSVKQELIKNGAEEALFDDMLYEDVLLLEGAQPGVKQTLYTSMAAGEDVVYELYPFSRGDRCLFVVKYEHTTAPKNTRACQILFCVRTGSNGFVPLEIDGSLTPDHAVSLFEKNGETLRGRAYLQTGFGNGGMEYKIQRSADAQRGYFLFAVKGLPENAGECLLWTFEQDNVLRIPYLSDNTDRLNAEYQTVGLIEDSDLWEQLSSWDVELIGAFR